MLPSIHLLYTHTQDMPVWKKKIVKKRKDEQAVAYAVRQEQEGEKQAKMAEIAGMPPWKRKLFLERNPQYMM